MEQQSFFKGSFVEEIMTDENITDISFNGTQCWVQHNIKGRFLSPVQPTLEQVEVLIKRLADIQKKEITTSNPILDTEIEEYRVNAMHESISPYGMTFAIRVSKPRRAIQSLTHLANKDVAKLIEILVRADSNIIISGKTGSGKTELQKTLVGLIPDSKKITLCEDTMDSHIKQLYPEKDINSWTTLIDDNRNKNIEFVDLIKAGLRNNPDWLLVSETRGAEAYNVLDSALTDHPIITTLHAKGAAAIPSRLIKMINQGTKNNDPILLGKEIVEYLKFGIHMKMKETENGIVRYIKEVVEFIDYGEKGAEYIPIYRQNKVYDHKEKVYKDVYEFSPLSKDTISTLEDYELYHELPECFIPKEKVA
ncbi:CpaF/VirB11 family protein [Margalitia sp. FSL K6-0131]|uniref:CpaF/VirB11 family protein n=1 Tax=Margalitia sp. FSL K6-0131 TaxID=2954604 RepID=UPI0030F4C4DE